MEREKRYGGARPRRASTSYTFEEKVNQETTGIESEFCLNCGYLNPKDCNGNKNKFYKCHAGSCPANRRIK